MAFEQSGVGGHDVRQRIIQGVGHNQFGLGFVGGTVDDGLRGGNGGLDGFNRTVAEVNRGVGQGVGMAFEQSGVSGHEVLQRVFQGVGRIKRKAIRIGGAVDDGLRVGNGGGDVRNGTVAEFDGTVSQSIRVTVGQGVGVASNQDAVASGHDIFQRVGQGVSGIKPDPVSHVGGIVDDGLGFGDGSGDRFNGAVAEIDDAVGHFVAGSTLEHVGILGIHEIRQRIGQRVGHGKRNVVRVGGFGDRGLRGFDGALDAQNGLILKIEDTVGQGVAAGPIHDFGVVAVNDVFQCVGHHVAGSRVKQSVIGVHEVRNGIIQDVARFKHGFFRVGGTIDDGLRVGNGGGDVFNGAVAEIDRAVGQFITGSALNHGGVGGHEVRQRVGQSVVHAVFQIGLVESAVKDRLRLGLSRFQIGDGHAFERSGTVSKEVLVRKGFGGKGVRKGQRHDRSRIVAFGDFAFGAAFTVQLIVLKSVQTGIGKGFGDIFGGPHLVSADGVQGVGLGLKVLGGVEFGGRVDAFGGAVLLIVFPCGKTGFVKSGLHVVNSLVGPFFGGFGIALQRGKLVGVVGFGIKQGIGRNLFSHAVVEEMLIRAFFAFIPFIGERLSHGIDGPVALGVGGLKLAQLQAIDPEGKQNGDKAWDADSLTAAMEAAGFKGEEGAYQHFMTYGAAENVSPNAAFDVDFYLAAKAAQLNDEQPGAHWTANKVYEAIQAAGMNVWEHYELYGSQEGIATSANFDSEKYFVEKTRLMNETKEDGRSDWSVAEVKAAFEAAGLSALEHYNEYGKAEFESAGKTADLNAAIKADPSITTDSHFNPYTGVQTYNTLVEALKAQKEGTLAEKYAITSTADAGTVTVAQQAGLADLLAGATPASSVTPTYFLTDTVAALADASTVVLTGSKGGEYAVADTLANAVAGADGLVNGANAVNATVAFGAKAATAKTDADVITTELKWDDLDGKADGHITLVRAEGDKAEGNAEIAINASDTAKAFGTANSTFDVDSANDAFDANGLTVKYSFTATAKDDFLKVGSEFDSVNGGNGNDFITARDSATAATLIGGQDADWLVGGKEADVIFAGSMTTLKDKVYGEGSDSIAQNAINAHFVEAFFGPNGNWMDPSAQAFFKGHNIVEGREGNDTLVASSGKDVFLFQTGGGDGTPASAELGFAALGEDTIHSFSVNEDALFIMNQSDRTGAIDGNSSATGLVFSAGWKFEAQTASNGDLVSAVKTGDGKTGNVTVTWSDNYHTATVVIDGDLVGQTQANDDLTINLVGVQGADASTTVADLFGLAQATA